MEGQDQTMANNLLQLLHLNRFHHMEEVKNIWILSTSLYFFNLSKKIFKLNSKTLLDSLLQNVILFYLIDTQFHRSLIYGEFSTRVLNFSCLNFMRTQICGSLILQFFFTITENANIKRLQM